MEKRKYILFAVVIFLFVFSMMNASAITAAMGNSRMIVRAAPGEEIEKYLLIKNLNNVTLTINMSAFGDLAENINLREESFTLEPATEKKAYFTIKAQENESTTETNINVLYIPQTGNGAGLSAKVIIITSGENVDIDDEDSDADDADSDNASGVKGDKVLSGMQILLLLTLMLVILLIILILYYLNNKKKSVGRTHAKQ